MRLTVGISTALVAVLLCGAQAQAAVVVGGGGLMTQAYADQIENWLNEGNLQFTNIYTKQTGDESYDFHTAVDGRGRTITLIEVRAGTVGEWLSGNFEFFDISAQVIGGYNPQSWSSKRDYNYSGIDERDAFIFNLTTLEKQDQAPYSHAGDPGAMQTYNSPFFGPTFGGGYDIYVGTDLVYGTSYNLSYGLVPNHDSIIDTPNDSHYISSLSYGAIEVFTIAPATAAVPEPTSLALLGIGGAAMAIGAARRRRCAM